jgi:hypothetical protein
MKEDNNNIEPKQQQCHKHSSIEKICQILHQEIEPLVNKK